MLDTGDTLLFALSAWRRCSWLQFRRAVDALQMHPATQPQVASEPDPGHRREAARILEALGHCDVQFDAGAGAIVTAPSVLARLPLAGLPRAVLCGSRSPDTLRAVRGTAAAAGRSLRVQNLSQAARAPFAPARIEIQAASDAALQKVAERLGVTYQPYPPAWSLGSMAGSLEDFMARLQWSCRPDLNWDRVDFDPAQLCFSGRRQHGAPLVLSRYQDPLRGQPVFWAWRGDECAPVDDPSLGRYAVLAASGRLAISYDPVACTLAVPATVPLPRLLARAACLCSGLACSIEEQPPPAAGVTSPRFQLYSSIPPDVHQAIAIKLGQLARNNHETDR